MNFFLKHHAAQAVMEAPENNLVSQYSQKGILYLVSTPIGDYSDMTILALNKLNECDIILCEDFKIAKRLLNFFGIQKELMLLNEHSQYEDINHYVQLLLQGKKIAQISDCGTPAFADPGLNLLRECKAFNIKYEFINGSNSILAAIVVSGFDISRFYYYGFLSPKKEIRIKEIYDISNLDYPAILMDTPYRLYQLLDDIHKVMPDRNLCLAMNLCTPEENIFHGTSHSIQTQITELYPDKIKPEFILIINKS